MGFLCEGIRVSGHGSPGIPGKGLGSRLGA